MTSRLADQNHCTTVFLRLGREHLVIHHTCNCAVIVLIFPEWMHARHDETSTCVDLNLFCTRLCPDFGGYWWYPLFSRPFVRISSTRTTVAFLLVDYPGYGRNAGLRGMCVARVARAWCVAIMDGGGFGSFQFGGPKKAHACGVSWHGDLGNASQVALCVW